MSSWLQSMPDEERRAYLRDAMRRHRARKKAQAEGLEGPPLLQPRYPEQTADERRLGRLEGLKKWRQDPEVKARQRALYESRRQAARDVYYGAKKDRPCIDCGEVFPPVAMDFHHRDGTEKIRDVAKMVALAYSVAKIEAEIEKCDLLCVCCHRLRTLAAQGWFDPEGDT